MPEYLENFGLDSIIAEELAVITGGHHGIFPHPNDIKNAKYSKSNIGKKHWIKLRKETVDELVKYTKIEKKDFPTKLTPASKIILAGLITLSDWIASNQAWFRPCSNKPLEEYVKTIDEKVDKALRESGWIGWESHDSTLPSKKLFNYIKEFEPRHLQEEIEKKMPELQDKPFLLIIEGPTGEGKTEGSIIVAEWCGVSGGIARGAYFALPTQATSNELYKRISQYLRNRYPLQKVPFHLVHSNAQLSDTFSETIICRLDQVYDEDKHPPGVIANEWFTYRKRPLLSPWGTGTIDQALMGILRSKHNFVRLFGLAGKTVILDEIHAYDAYTSTLIEWLLEWLAALGSPVVAMSATLSQKQRETFVAAYSRGFGESAPILNQCPYPRLTICSPKIEQNKVISFNISKLNASRKIRFEWIDEAQIPQILENSLKQGGTAAILRTQIAWAQQTYQDLIPSTFSKDERILLHSRFLHIDRKQQEKRCLAVYGKEVDKTKVRPRSACAATQIIEQSLDLDFDLMISDLAPIDLLLQRIGRIWRHDRVRPTGITEPLLYLIRPKFKDDLPDFDFIVEKFIYERHLLLRTWDVLNSLDGYLEPFKFIDSKTRQIDYLIEQVYDFSHPPLASLNSATQDDWNSSQAKLESQIISEQRLARNRNLPHVNQQPEAWELTHRPENADLVTRLTPRTVTVVLAQETARGLILPRSRSKRQIHPNRKPTKEEVKDILDHSVNLTKRGLVDQLEALPTESGWIQNTLLRNVKLLRLQNGYYSEIPNWQISLNDELGVITTQI